MPTHAPTIDDEALRDRLTWVLAEALPLREGPYTLSLRPLGPEEAASYDHQAGPLLFSEGRLLASFQFDGVARFGGPWHTSAFAVLCALPQADGDRAEARVRGFLAASRRVMADSAASPFSDKPWFDLGHLAGALREGARAPQAKARSPEDFEAIFLRTRSLREHVLPEQAAGEAALARVDAWVGAHGELARVGVVQVSVLHHERWSATETYSEHGVRRSRQGLHATMELTLFEEGAAKPTIRDIKQQEVLVAPTAALGDPDRLVAFLDGWARTLPRLFAERAGLMVDTLMPHDLVLTDVLALKTPRNAEEFAAVCARRFRLDPGGATAVVSPGLGGDQRRAR
jgi:hypothetical protein